jgi:hypothetical protein
VTLSSPANVVMSVAAIETVHPFSHVEALGERFGASRRVFAFLRGGTARDAREHAPTPGAGVCAVIHAR